jgi:hypothetical protein
VRIDKVGVIKNIQTNNPAITSVQVDFYRHEYWRDSDDLIEVDWDAAGRSIGASQHIKFLYIRVRTAMDPSDLKAFVGGLSNNRSILDLKIFFQFVDHGDGHVDEIITFEQVFKALLSFFQFNNNLQVFDFRLLENSQPVPSKVPSMLYDAI